MHACLRYQFTVLCNWLGHEISGVNEVSSERLVYKYMMDGYNPSVRPVRNDYDSVDLYVDIVLYLLQDLVSSTTRPFCSFCRC